MLSSICLSCIPLCVDRQRPGDEQAHYNTIHEPKQTMQSFFSQWLTWNAKHHSRPGPLPSICLLLLLSTVPPPLALLTIIIFYNIIIIILSLLQVLYLSITIPLNITARRSLIFISYGFLFPGFSIKILLLPRPLLQTPSASHLPQFRNTPPERLNSSDIGPCVVGLPRRPGPSVPRPRRTPASDVAAAGPASDRTSSVCTPPSRSESRRAPDRADTSPAAATGRCLASPGTAP